MPVVLYKTSAFWKALTRVPHSHSNYLGFDSR